jgi:hypothetical protein
MFSREKNPARQRPECARRVPETGPYSLLIRHKILCRSVDKIMPVEALCQAFGRFFSVTLYQLKTVSYKPNESKYFKKQAKKMTLS